MDTHFCLDCRKSVQIRREISEPDDKGICIVTIKCAECGEVLQTYGQPERELQ